MCFISQSTLLKLRQIKFEAHQRRLEFGLIWPQLLYCWDSYTLFPMHFSFIAAAHQDIDDGQFGVHSKLDKKQKLLSQH